MGDHPISERNDTKAIQRSILAFRNSNWSGNNINYASAILNRQSHGGVFVEYPNRDSAWRQYASHPDRDF
jgi:hypothetical protein